MCYLPTRSSYLEWDQWRKWEKFLRCENFKEEEKQTKSWVNPKNQQNFIIMLEWIQINILLASDKKAAGHIEIVCVLNTHMFAFSEVVSYKFRLPISFWLSALSVCWLLQTRD